jgi:hypothetical protein
MGVSLSLLLVAVGAVLYWAVDVATSGVNLHTVGLILMIVGGVGLLLSLAFWSTWGGFGGYRRDRVVRDDGVVRDERIIERPY